MMISEPEIEPLIKLVDHVIQQAILQSTSDIHIEPFIHGCRIRFRRDGVLYESSTIPSELSTRFISRLKIMAKLDITERRLPQDGRFQQQGIDVRMNTCPTLFGEKIVLRLLNANHFLLNLDTLGFTNHQKELFIRHISQPQGLILVTGPTGSGKTVTLYSALHHLNSIEKNISTVEDPIEIQLNGINQVNINPKIGLDFSTVLRTLLRQDPDTIMVGEIRDLETAEMAIQAAHTGHLVLSTLHTNSTIDTLFRLTALGIKIHYLVDSISLIISQRLIRVLCRYCKKQDGIFYQPVGCEHCLNGYQGRTGIYEMLPFTKQISELLLSNPNPQSIKKLMQNEGYTLLSESAHEKLLQGITSKMELNRVLYHAL